MVKHIFRERMCVVCPNVFVPTGPRNRWCSMFCRMLDQVDRSAGANACWPWKASLDKKGYGEIAIKDGSRPSGTYFAHRIALEVLGGVAVSDADKVRHSCDRPICCNPHHLLVGTQADNVRDMVERGRQQDYSSALKGEDHPGAKITAATAIEIFNTVGMSAEIAAQFGVSYNIAAAIKSGEAWSHVTGAAYAPPGRAVGDRNFNSKLTADAVREIRSSTTPGVVFAKRFGVSQAAISAVRKGKVWTHIK